MRIQYGYACCEGDLSIPNALIVPRSGVGRFILRDVLLTCSVLWRKQEELT